MPSAEGEILERNGNAICGASLLKMEGTPTNPRDVEGSLTILPGDGPLLARGVCRLLRDLGYGTLTEFSLRSRRRADAIGVSGNGHVVIVETKTSETDYRTDAKWHEYREFCDAFYFAVPREFPKGLIPEDCGLIVADAHGAAVVREAPLHPLHSSRRKALLLRFAVAASTRLQRMVDPEP